MAILDRCGHDHPISGLLAARHGAQNADGTPAVWLMNGTSLVSGGNVAFNPGAAWHAIGTGDCKVKAELPTALDGNSGGRPVRSALPVFAS